MIRKRQDDRWPYRTWFSAVSCLFRFIQVIRVKRSLVAVLVALLPQGVPAQPAQIDPTAALLAELIRVNTSNPPGNERGIAELLAPRFMAAGFQVDVIPTPDSAKAHFVARLKGNGSKRPVLI